MPLASSNRPAASDVSTGGGYTGQKRRSTRRIVKIVDRVAKYTICVGGLSVVLAFAGIVFFIASVVVPLFGDGKFVPLSSATLAKGSVAGPATSPSTTTPTTQVSLSPATTQSTGVRTKPLAMGMDENVTSLWVLDGTGDLTSYQASTGQLIKVVKLSKDPITAFSNNRSDIAIGFADGTVRFGQVGLKYEYLEPSAVPIKFAAGSGQTAIYKDGVAMMTGSNQVRVVRTEPDLVEPLLIGDEPASPITSADYNFSDNLEVLAAMRADGRLFFNTITKKENVMTGKIKRTAENHELPVPPSYKGQTPAALLLGLNGRLVFLVYADGRAIRYSVDNPEKAYVAEEANLLPAGQKVASIRMLLGSLTLIVTDTAGGVTGWFPAPLQGKEGPKDGLHLVKAHTLENQSGPVVAIGTSARDRQFVTADAKGEIVVRHMTSGTTQGRIQVGSSAAVSLVAISPKTDAVAVLDEASKLTLLHLDNPHPDGKLPQLFSKIWYEGYAEPGYTYQSSAGTDDAELKLSLIPLIFGTFKATFYAMLFAVPIAVLAAIYTSEFMQPQLRSVVKPVIEMMASLPSVVLGFVAALVLAPIVENIVLSVLSAIFVVPLGMALFGFLWQVLPPFVIRRISAITKYRILFGLVVFLLGASLKIGPLVETLLFFGDFKGWLDHRIGTATPGWTILFSPLCLLFVVFAFNKWIQPRFANRPQTSTHLKQAGMELGRAFVFVAAAIALAWVLGSSLSLAGVDIRGSVIGSYVQRNSLILGIVMGFAIIPIIYTVSEDALASVPDSLRSAALGAGATPWQTAIRVVLPVATSGIFSAIMIGFGRAAGETMVVLMASGRTPVMDLNIFNGLSALSANIAVELPEAPVGSTHYRVLFMSAIVLFALTFIVNTTAEAVRIRFRKRAYQL